MLVLVQPVARYTLNFSPDTFPILLSPQVSLPSAKHGMLSGWIPSVLCLRGFKHGINGTSIVIRLRVDSY